MASKAKATETVPADETAIAKAVAEGRTVMATNVQWDFVRRGMDEGWGRASRTPVEAFRMKR